MDEQKVHFYNYSIEPPLYILQEVRERDIQEQDKGEEVITSEEGKGVQGELDDRAEQERSVEDKRLRGE